VLAAPIEVEKTKGSIDELAKSIRKSNKEYEHLNEEVELHTKMQPIVQKPPKITSMDHWFETYGRPNSRTTSPSKPSRLSTTKF